MLHHYQPPTTVEEIRAAALQYVRKVSGVVKPSTADQAAFERAMEEVARTTERLLAELTTPRSPARTREGEKEKAKARWEKREAMVISKKR